MTQMHFQGPGFHLQIPSDWLITSSPQFQAMFIAPPGTTGRANLAITLRPVEDKATLVEIADAARRMQQRDFKEYQVISEGELENTNQQGYSRTYRWLNEQTNSGIYQRQWMFLVKGILTTLTATREDTAPAAALDPIFDGMISSFSFD